MVLQNHTFFQNNSKVNFQQLSKIVSIFSTFSNFSIIVIMIFQKGSLSNLLIQTFLSVNGRPVRNTNSIGVGERTEQKINFLLSCFKSKAKPNKKNKKIWSYISSTNLHQPHFLKRYSSFIQVTKINNIYLRNYYQLISFPLRPIYNFELLSNII